MGVIYKVTNTVDGKIYVGKTIASLATRWRQHRFNARSGVNTYLYKAMRKHGIENFQIEILATALLAEEVEGMEVEWISRLNSTDVKVGYNCTAGGDSGLHTTNSRNRVSRPMSASAKAKISAARLGKPLSPEHRAASGRAMAGKKHSEETKRKMAETHRRRYQENPWEMPKQTAERRAAHSLRARAWWANNPDQKEKLAQFHRERYRVSPWPTPTQDQEVLCGGR